MTSTSRPKASRLPRRAALGGLIAVAALAPVAAAQGATCDATAGCDLYARSDAAYATGAGTVAAMGYSTTSGGQPTLPGPVIVATAGQPATVTLHNALGQKTGLLFQEQPLPPDVTGVADGGTRTYTFTPPEPGTYIYEASPFVLQGLASQGSQYQAAMGMTGVLIVRPAGAPGQAYDASTAFDVEHVVVLNDLDAALTLTNAPTFDMRNFAPDYHLVNGKVAPATADLEATSGQKVLLREVNAAVSAHALSVLGIDGTVVGEDGNALANPRHAVSETLGAGQTEDVILDTTGVHGRVPVYDAGLWMNNNTASGMGGMLAYLSLGAPTPGTLPVTRNVRVVGTDLKADVAGATSARYFVDTLSGGGTDMAAPAGGTFTASVAAVTGSHTFYVQGSADGGTTWGPVSSVIYANADGSAPVTRSLSLTPNPSNGSADVALAATGDDSTTGGSGIDAAEYRIDGGAAVAMTLGPDGPVRSETATIAAATVAALSSADHTVEVRSHDAAGNWGAWTPVTLTKDTAGPVGSAPSATPAATNGTQGFSATVQAVRVKFTATDAAKIVAGEGFLKTPGANGAGFPLVPADGAFSGPSEVLQADIPLATVKNMGDGVWKVHMHAKDAAGNWGDAATTFANLTVDSSPPALSVPTATPNPTNTAATNNTSLALSVNATDLSGVTQAEWFRGTDPGAGNGTPMTVPANCTSCAITANVDWFDLGWTSGTRTIRVRAKDGAGNAWSGTQSVTVQIVNPADWIFRDGFETGNASRWSSLSNSSNRVTFTAGAATAGSYGMAVTLTGTSNGTSYVTDTRPAGEAQYYARVYIKPNGANPGNTTNGRPILTGHSSDTGGTTRFQVWFRNNAAGTAPEVAYVIGTANPVAANWHALTATGASWVQVRYAAAGAIPAGALTVNGTAFNAGGATTGQGGVQSVRLGVQGLSGAGRTGTLMLDQFASKRLTAVGP